MKRGIAVLLIMLMFSVLVYGAENNQRSALHKVAALDKVAIVEEIHMDVNRFDATMSNNGIWMYNVLLSDKGGIWPKGSGNATIFGAGQWIAASVNNQVRCAGIIHDATEFQPGMILPDGTADSPLDGAYQWYIINSDGSGDYANWPVDQGAPVDEAGNPKVFGDRTAFCVWNDLGNHPQFQTNKLGAEVRQTVFAFNRADAMGDMIFIKWEIINKGEADWDSTYLSIWVDPDIGGYDDDYVGCDEDLGLGYCYNADNVDSDYGTAPPAAGVDFFQGPVIDNPDSTVVLPDGTELPGKMMLNMTAFVYYNNDDTEQGNPETAADVWNYMRGFWRDGTPITYGGTGTDPDADPTAFMFTGDPETDTGWLDANAADRRFLMTVGPFNMPLWDDAGLDGEPETGDSGENNGKPDFGETGVQVIVAAVINARGSNNLNSVTTLKEVDNLAQLAYDLNFKLAKSPSPPRYMNETDSQGNATILVTELPNEVVLAWDDYSEFNEDRTPYESADPIVGKAYGDTVIIDNLVTVIDDSTYNYYGYTVYQYSDAAGSEPVEIAHWDVGGQADAVPYTGARHFRITNNKHATVGTVGDPLINGKEYYFGVSAEGYCEFGAPRVFPSAATIVTIVPQNWPGEKYINTTPDTSYTNMYGDTIAVTMCQVDTLEPEHDGRLIVWVADPRSLTGHDYKVEFEEDSTGAIVWNLLDVTDNEYVLENQANQTGDDAYTVVDGLVVKAIGPAPGIKSMVELDPATGEIYDANLWGSLNNYGRSQEWPIFIMHETGETALDLARVDRFGFMTPKDYEIIFTDDDSTLAFDYMSDTVLKDTLTDVPTFLPFTCWRIDLDGTRTRIPVTVLDDDGDGTWNRSYYNPWVGPGYSFEPLYVYDDVAYDPAAVQSYIDANDGTTDPGYGPYGVTGPAIHRLCFAMYIDYDEYATPDQLDPDGIFWGPPHAGEHIKIITNKPNTPNDYFTFTAPDAKSMTAATAKIDLNKILVVPNPYYGYHSGEMDPFDRWVQFTNLPEKCTISIFDLAGHLVRKLEKDDETTSLMQWDLHNAYDLPVASGVYVYYVDVPNVGTKIGKMAVFTPNERLDIY